MMYEKKLKVQEEKLERYKHVTSGQIEALESALIRLKYKHRQEIETARMHTCEMES